MLLNCYDPENNQGKIWWNEDNPGMKAIWGTQEDYDNFKKKGEHGRNILKFVKKED